MPFNIEAIDRIHKRITEAIAITSHNPQYYNPLLLDQMRWVMEMAFYVSILPQPNIQCVNQEITNVSNINANKNDALATPLSERPRSLTQQQEEGECTLDEIILSKRRRLHKRRHLSKHGIGIRRKRNLVKLLPEAVEERSKERASMSTESIHSDSTMGSLSEDEEFAEFEVNNISDDSNDEFLLSDSDSEDEDNTPVTSINADAAAMADAAQTVDAAPTADAATTTNTTEKSAEKKAKLR